LNGPKHFVVIDILERMGQREYCQPGDDKADDDTKAPQSDTANTRLLQRNDFQGVSIRATTSIIVRLIRLIATPH
jgi:hypothetical protein